MNWNHFSFFSFCRLWTTIWFFVVPLFFSLILRFFLDFIGKKVEDKCRNKRTAWIRWISNVYNVGSKLAAVRIQAQLAAQIADERTKNENLLENRRNDYFIFRYNNIDLRKYRTITQFQGISIQYSKQRKYFLIYYLAGCVRLRIQREWIAFKLNACFFYMEIKYGPKMEKCCRCWKRMPEILSVDDVIISGSLTLWQNARRE